MGVVPSSERMESATPKANTKTPIKRTIERTERFSFFILQEVMQKRLQRFESNHFFRCKSNKSLALNENLNDE